MISQGIEWRCHTDFTLPIFRQMMEEAQMANQHNLLLRPFLQVPPYLIRSRVHRLRSPPSLSPLTVPLLRHQAEINRFALHLLP